MAHKTTRIRIKGMTCQGCADTVSRYLKREKGVEQVSIDWKSGSGEVSFDPAATSEGKILQSKAFTGPYSAELA